MSSSVTVSWCFDRVFWPFGRRVVVCHCSAETLWCLSMQTTPCLFLTRVNGMNTSWMTVAWSIRAPPEPCRTAPGCMDRYTPAPPSGRLTETQHKANFPSPRSSRRVFWTPAFTSWMHLGCRSTTEATSSNWSGWDPPWWEYSRSDCKPSPRLRPIHNYHGYYGSTGKGCWNKN